MVRPIAAFILCGLCFAYLADVQAKPTTKPAKVTTGKPKKKAVVVTTAKPKAKAPEVTTTAKPKKKAVVVTTAKPKTKAPVVTTAKPKKKAVVTTANPKKKAVVVTTAKPTAKPGKKTTAKPQPGTTAGKHTTAAPKELTTSSPEPAKKKKAGIVTKFLLLPVWAIIVVVLAVIATIFVAVNLILCLIFEKGIFQKLREKKAKTDYTPMDEKLVVENDASDKEGKEGVSYGAAASEE